ncbi:MAG: hypothetical protein LBS09_07405 [Bacteroidales bacterium]|jgi:hypothetical protein|nr:hypothetical protein [Bacteroidales bacterium]
MSDFIVSFGLPLAYIAFFIPAIAAIAFPLIFLFQDIKKAKSALIGIGALIVVFVICYVLADSTPYDAGGAIGIVTSGEMKMINASLLGVYILGAGSILAIAYASVSRYFKK